jgi:hypothetical protein
MLSTIRVLGRTVPLWPSGEVTCFGGGGDQPPEMEASLLFHLCELGPRIRLPLSDLLTRML